MTPASGVTRRGRGRVVAKRSQVIIEDYLRRIVSGELAEGQLLPTETALIERYGVSRTAVREAIQVLESKGFVRIRQGSGSTVAPRSSWNVLDPDYLAVTGSSQTVFDDVLEVRDLLEPAIAGLAARRAEQGDLDALQALSAELAASARKGAGVHADLDVAFHHRLAECTGNPVLIAVHGSLAQLSQRHRPPTADRQGSFERLVFWHEHIVDAVGVKDAVAAQDAMRMHLRQAHSDYAGAGS